MRSYGGAPVPFTVAWTDELQFSIGVSAYVDGRCICQIEKPTGRPVFGRPHYERQRMVMSRELCDLCAKPLANRTKISLSDIRPEIGMTQFEPMLHKECAAESCRHCPSLRRQIREGRLFVRQVLRYAVFFSAMSPESVAAEVPGYVASPSDQIFGFASLQLLGWRDRGAAWLLANEHLAA